VAEKRLTDVQIRRAKPPAKLYDGGGLELHIKPTGKYWLFRYKSPSGKRREMGLGRYPEVSLAEARKLRDEARKLLHEGLDPIEERRKRELERQRQERTFARVAMQWFEQNKAGFQGKAEQYLAWFKNDIFPAIGNMPLHTIKRSEHLLPLIERIAQEHGEKARRVRQLIARVFEYAIEREWVEDNPAAAINPRNLPKKQSRNYPRITNPLRLGQLLLRIESYPNLIIRNALLMLAYTFVRPGEVRGARWDEFDFHERLWRIPAERMKMKRDHLVPLSKQVLAILDEMRPISGNDELVFPGMRKGKPLSENTLNQALRRMGIDTKLEHTSHGFRGSAMTILAEKGWASEIVDRQLAHRERDKVKAAYNHAEYLQDRIRMMQWWADFLDEQRRRAMLKVV